MVSSRHWPYSGLGMEYRLQPCASLDVAVHELLIPHNAQAFAVKSELSSRLESICTYSYECDLHKSGATEIVSSVPTPMLTCVARWDRYHPHDEIANEEDHY